MNHWRWIQWARSQKVGNKSEKAVLCALATYANWETGTCIVKQRTLAEHCELGMSTVNPALAALEAKGFIQRKARGQQGARLPDEIKLMAAEALSQLPATGDSEGFTSSNPQPTTSNPRGSQLPATGDGTLQFQPTMKNPPKDFSHSRGRKAGRRAALPWQLQGLPPDFPTTTPVQKARQMLVQSDLYLSGVISIGGMAEDFKAHAQRTGRLIQNIDAAWVAWVKHAIERAEQPDAAGGHG